MVSIICCTIREQFMENVFQNYDNQTIENKELIIILNDKDMDLASWRTRAANSKNVTVYRMPKFTLGECLNFGITNSRYDIIAKYDDDDYYAPNYLADQVKLLQRKHADMVCKRTVFMYFEEKKTLAIHLDHFKVNRFIERNRGVKGSTLVFHKKMWKHVKFDPVNSGEDSSFLKKCLKKKYKIFAANRFNYVCIRRNEKDHTWKSNNNKLLKRSKPLSITEEYKQVAERVKKLRDNKDQEVKKAQDSII